MSRRADRAGTLIDLHRPASCESGERRQGAPAEGRPCQSSKRVHDGEPISSTERPSGFKQLRASMGAPRCGFELPGSPAFAVYFDWRHRMATESLAEVVRSLTPQEQDAVRQFIDYLKQRDAAVLLQSPFLQAADEFISHHPELLQRLA